MSHPQYPVASEQPPSQALGLAAVVALRQNVAPTPSRLPSSQFMAANEDANAQTHIYEETNLLDLPNELLELVALHLCGSAAVFSLSLANKRLQDIVQAAMILKLCIPKRGIRHVLKMLVAKPYRFRRIRHIDLTKYGCDHVDNCQCLGPLKFKALTAQLLQDCIKHNSTHNIVWQQIRKAKPSKYSWHNKAHNWFLNILVSLCPKLKELTIWLPPRKEFANARSRLMKFDNEWSSQIPFDGSALLVLQRCLRVLTIRTDFRCKRDAGYILQFPNFHALRSLTIPMDTLGWPARIDFYRPDGSNIKSRKGHKLDRAEGKLTCLPLTLEDLHATSCNKWTLILLDIFNRLPKGGLRLKHITMSFDMSSSSAIALCCTSQVQS